MEPSQTTLHCPALRDPKAFGPLAPIVATRPGTTPVAVIRKS